VGMVLKKHCLFIVLYFLLSSSALASESRKAELLSIYQSIKNKQVVLLQNQPLSIKSTVTEDRLSADIYAIKHYDFQKLATDLSKPASWCRFVTLHLNIKACTYTSAPNTSLTFYAGRKFYEPAEDAFELRYQFKLDSLDKEYFRLNLTAKDGPMGTEDYLIRLEILKVDKQLLLHMSLSYQTSFTSRLGTSVYLSTIGSDKVGFSQELNDKGELNYIGGIEAIIERNVMRYFLALSTYLNRSDQVGMIKSWYLATENYARQLHEVKEDDYFKSKQREFEQQFLMQQRIDAGKPVFETILGD
jgi:hypothetical protein